MNLASADAPRHALRHFGRFSGFTAARSKTGWAATALLAAALGTALPAIGAEEKPLW